MENISKQLLISVICLFFCLVIGVFFAFPKYKDLKIIEAQVEQKQNELEYRQEYLVKVQEISEELKKYSEELEKIDFALDSDISLPFLFDFFQKISSQNGLVLKNINSSASFSENKNEVQEININLSLFGSYSAFKSFLLNIEKSVRLIEVDEFSFSFDAKQDDALSFNLKVKTYSY
ncbi:MAG: type 4a pilus biogenesis protein PilO [Patescibacteria group bacterium]|nr:type 4a pilus biogenesis protein PilO [Patescibacteria group bacterium]